ncbi:AfsR/SARP family transcriptional regulator [Amycolatopsis sp. NPDC051128]|uniref:AfsR/SARP family transcriptional regulator n=1 Tax=Amycolatopsis sp. NPDC051128 TaxID=3155412 RepID=UPI00343995C8
MGPLELIADSGRVRVSPKVAQVLALLLVRNGQFVSCASLIEELWEDTPPKTAVPTMQTYIVQLRKILAEVTGLSAAEVAEEVLRTRRAGYQLTLPDEAVDLAVHDNLLNAAEAALATDQDAAIALWQRADRLWRGDLAADVEHGRLLRSAAASLAEARIAVAERRLGIELNRGRHREVLAELAGLVREYPLHEGLHAKYMLALYRSGCRGRALQSYHGLRRAMADELGVEPALPLRRLFVDLLGDNEVLEPAG